MDFRVADTFTDGLARLTGEGRMNVIDNDRSMHPNQ
jgi:hypothetical protein